MLCQYAVQGDWFRRGWLWWCRMRRWWRGWGWHWVDRLWWPIVILIFMPLLILLPHINKLTIIIQVDECQVLLLWHCWGEIVVYEIGLINSLCTWNSFCFILCSHHLQLHQTVVLWQQVTYVFLIMLLN